MSRHCNTHCKTLQQTRCNTLQHTTTHYKTLQSDLLRIELQVSSGVHGCRTNSFQIFVTMHPNMNSPCCMSNCVCVCACICVYVCVCMLAHPPRTSNQINLVYVWECVAACCSVLQCVGVMQRVAVACARLLAQHGQARANFTVWSCVLHSEQKSPISQQKSPTISTNLPYISAQKSHTSPQKSPISLFKSPTSPQKKCVSPQKAPQQCSAVNAVSSSVLPFRRKCRKCPTFLQMSPIFLQNSPISPQNTPMSQFRTKTSGKYKCLREHGTVVPKQREKSSRKCSVVKHASFRAVA